MASNIQLSKTVTVDNQEDNLEMRLSDLQERDDRETLMKGAIQTNSMRDADDVDTFIKSVVGDSATFNAGSSDASLRLDEMVDYRPDDQDQSLDTNTPLKTPETAPVKVPMPDGVNRDVSSHKQCNYLNAVPVKPTKEHDLEIDEHVELPLKFRLGHYDVLLLCHQMDFDLAMKIKRVLSYLYFDERQTDPVKVLMLGDPDSEYYDIQGVVPEISAASQRCTLYFMLMSPSFCDDDWKQMEKDELLWASIHEPEKRWSVIPLHLEKRINPAPFGLASLRGIQVPLALTNGRNIEDPNILLEDITEKDVNPMFSKAALRLIKARRNLRHEREMETKQKVDEFIQEELHKRRLAAADKQVEVERVQRQREKEIRQAMEQNEKRRMEPLPQSKIHPTAPYSPAAVNQPRQPAASPTQMAEQKPAVHVSVVQNNYIGAPAPAAAVMPQQQQETEEVEEEEEEEEAEEYVIIRGPNPAEQDH